MRLPPFLRALRRRLSPAAPRAQVILPLDPAEEAVLALLRANRAALDARTGQAGKTNGAARRG